MIIYYSTILFIIVSIVPCSFDSSSNDHFSNEEVLVQTKSGPINGFKDSFDGQEVNVFLGIPYAEPPIGGHRFRKPEPVKEWTQPLSANKWPNNCQQTNTELGQYKSDVFSEDCLYLNIWSPLKKSNGETLKPVIVYIHGGGFSVGSSSHQLLDSKVLSIVGDVIVVTLNYRLEAFGFLFTDTDEAPGNVGLWDQLMALKWVNDNIESFGGNPKNITLMGLNAGSWSVSLHLLSEQSHHLFQNAILMSGVAYNYRTNTDPKLIKKVWLKAAIDIGCSPKQEFSYIEFTPEIIECLKTISPEKVLKLTSGAPLSEPLIAWDRLVVVDGQFLPKKPTEMFGEIKYAETKNIFIGSLENEGLILMVAAYDQGKYNPLRPKDMTFEEGFKELSVISANFPTNLKVIGDEVSQLYFNGMDNRSSPTKIRDTIASAVGDFYFTCPTMRFAERLFINNIDSVKVYQYYYTNFQDIGIKWITKATHASDRLPVFGVPLLSPDSNERQKQISKQMIEMFSHFAKFGHPKSPNGLPFKPYYAITDRVVKPFYEISENPKPNNNFGIGLKNIECNYLWNKYLDY